MKQKKQVRLSDIAEKLNISTVTVSKALSDNNSALNFFCFLLFIGRATGATIAQFEFIG